MSKEKTGEFVIDNAYYKDVWLISDFYRYFYIIPFNNHKHFHLH